MYITNLKDVKKIRTPHGKWIQWLIPHEVGAKNFEMRYVEVPAESTPSEESHPWEHQVFVLSGKGYVKSGNDERLLSPGDALYLEPNEPHQFRVEESPPLAFICLIPSGCEDKVKDH